MTEVWKPVKGYEGLYEVSNLGRVKSLPRTTTKGGLMSLKPNMHGYVCVQLSKNGVIEMKRVHILVMEAFRGFKKGRGYDPDNVIDHLDCDKTNNRLENLDVCTQKENDRRQREHGLQPAAGTKVIDLISGDVFDSYTSAARSAGGNTGEMVARVCRGERSHYRGRVFAKYEDYIQGTIPEYKGSYKRKESKTLWR